MLIVLVRGDLDAQTEPVQLLLEQRLEIAAAVEDVKDQNVASLRAVNDDVRSNWKASQPRTQIVIARATHVRMFG